MADLWQDSEARKNFENVFNEETLRALYKLSDKGHFEVLHGFAKLGKESNVCVAEQSDGTKIAAKIYMVEAGGYREMQKYLLNDPRFQGIKRNRRSIIHNWCKKEYKNLMKAQQAGVDAPEPIAFKKNVLLMEFLGDGFEPAPRLKDVTLEEPEREFDHIIDQVRLLWQEEDLVHGDLSEFNILWHRRPHLIDFSQGVLQSHPLADELLERDLENLCTHMEKRYDLRPDRDQLIAQIRGEKSGEK